MYDTYSLTEDNELTLALKSLGARLLSPKECRVRTELMPRDRAGQASAARGACDEQRPAREWESWTRNSGHL